MIVARWLSRELALTFLAVILTLWFASAGARLLDYLGEAAAGEIAPAMLWVYVVNRLPKTLQLVLPVSTFLAAALTAGRGYAEREWIVLESSGASPHILPSLVVLLALLPTLALAGLTLWVTPACEARLAARAAAAARHAAVGLLQSGRFVSLGSRGATVFAGHVDRTRGELADILIVDAMHEDDPLTVIHASTGRQVIDARTSAVAMVLEHGARVRGRRDAGPMQTTKFERLRLQLRNPDDPRESRADSLPTIALAQDLFAPVGPAPAVHTDPASDNAGSAHSGGDRATRMAELYWRISLPLSALVGAALAVVLVRARPNDGRFDRMLPAGLVFLAYFGAIMGARAWISDERALGIMVGLSPHLTAIAFVVGASLRGRHPE